MSVASSCWERVDQALERHDAKGVATAAQEGLCASAYDERRRFFTQLRTVLLRHGSRTDAAPCVAEAGELLWMMPEFRSSTVAGATVSGETLLLADAVATAYTTMENFAKALAFDHELLQSPAFFTYEGFTAEERMACVARMLTASRRTNSTRHVDSTVQKGMSIYHGLEKSRRRLSGAAAQQQCDAVAGAYLFELGCYRQRQKDYMRAFQSFFALYERTKQLEALRRAALAALCIRSSAGVRQGALHDVLQVSSAASLPSLHPFVYRAYHQQLFRAEDTAGVLAAAEDFVPTAVLRDAVREHNIRLLAKTFDCVKWRSLCVHMDDAELTEGALYDLLVEMVRGQRLVVSIHQDTGFIEFGEREAGVERHLITDADVFNRIAQTTAMIAAAHPELHA